MDGYRTREGHFEALEPRLTALVGYLVSSLWSYWLNWRITFRRAPVPSHVRAFAAFLTVGAAGAAVSSIWIGARGVSR